MPFDVSERVFLLLWHIADIAHGKDTHRYPIDRHVDTTIQVLELTHGIDHIIEVASMWAKGNWKTIRSARAISGIESSHNLVETYHW